MCARGCGWSAFPAILKQVRKVLPTRVVFLEASEDALVRRFSETRRPHPMGRDQTVVHGIRAERKRLDPIRNVADIVLDTTKFNVHELRAHINAQFERGVGERGPDDFLVQLRLQERRSRRGRPGLRRAFSAQSALCAGVPQADRASSQGGEVHPAVSPDAEFLDKATEMLKFLLPHYIEEGKSYLTVAFGCTGGQHRSVFIAEEMKKRLEAAGYRVKTAHRDMPR